MRRLAVLVSFVLWSLCPASLAQDSSLPICSDEEFLEFFHLIVEHQLLFDGDITNANMLHLLSRAQIERRASYPTNPPLCSDAIAIQRLLIQLGGDALARAALELADTVARDNPYLQRLPNDQARIEELLSERLGFDRSRARPSDQRILPACEPEEWALLDDAAAVLVDAAEPFGDNAGRAEALAAIDRLLLWRESAIPALPHCAEAIDLIQAMSAAATDSAAYYAFTYGGVSAERNPFPPLIEAAIATVTSWREQIPAGASGNAAASTTRAIVADRLPACAHSELTEVFANLPAEYAALIERAETTTDGADLAVFGRAQIAFRDARLAALPTCAEALEARWWTAEALADAALRSAIESGAPALIASGLEDAMERNDSRASAGWEKFEKALGHQDTSVSESGGSKSIAPLVASAPECADADHLFFYVYLIPEFWRLTDDTLKLSQPDEVAAFIDKTYAFRQLIWANLPRCGDALEMGLIMRAVAADAAAMLAQELAGAPAQGSPYLPKIAADIERFSEWADQFNATCGAINSATTTYYVVAENIANIRSCASTSCTIVTTASRGQRLDVVDDLSNWYEIILPSCETAYIAGFLASQTPPAR